MVVMPDLVAPVVSAGRLRDQSQPELFIDELVLRPWRSADAPGVVRRIKTRQVARFSHGSLALPAVILSRSGIRYWDE